MNPIIFIDEVDKISNTEYGKEITSILTHLTDATQNDNFEDKYFSGIPLDLSKALIIFSFNDINLLDPILRDRITVIETKPYTLPDKLEIIKNHMISTIMNDIGFDKNEIILTDDIITYLIETFTNEAGVRKIKELIVEIIRDINLKYMHNEINYKLPIVINKEYINELFKNKHKMRINMIHKNPEIGLVNGLYATTTGVGGLTVIQVMKYPSDKMLDLTITGQQGDVMKESVNYALRIAYSLLTDEEKDKILMDASNKKNFGLLIHTPEAATKKDGPSAGAAMTLAIYSVLTCKKIRNDIAMTGEIDLCKNVRAIGGVYAKLSGAKAAGVKLALIPKENLEDLIILRNENISPEDDTFKVKLIETFDDILNITL
jgi:ATP-dependent Lon protease